ncbi:hypothetical protein [Streptomyces sp. NPDC000878]
MADAPKINDVRLSDDGVLEFYDGTAWVVYPDVPDDATRSPFAVSRRDAPSADEDGPQ